MKLQGLGLRISQQKELPVMFEGQKVGEQVVDLLVEECVIVEIKAIQNLSWSNEAQLPGYLKLLFRVQACPGRLFTVAES